MGEWERVIAENIGPGDNIARTRKEPVQLVGSIGPIGPSSRWIVFANGGRIRPNHDRKFWRWLP